MTSFPLKKINKKVIFISFTLLIAPTLYFYTNCGAADKVADIWESDPLSARHREIAIKVLRKYRNIYVSLFPHFVTGAHSNIFLGRAGNTNHQLDHYNQVLDCIDDALDAYNERSGSANLYYFNDEDRIFGIDNDDGATAAVEGNAVFIRESDYERAIEYYQEDPFVVDGSFTLFQTLVHEFNHWNGATHVNVLQASHPDFHNFLEDNRTSQLDLFYTHSDSSYYFELGILQSMAYIISPHGQGVTLGGEYYKNYKCQAACESSIFAEYSENFPTVWQGEIELDWYGIDEEEYSTMAQNMCSSVLIDSSLATDPMNVCSRESSVKNVILNYHEGLCNCEEVDATLLSQVLNLIIDNSNVTSLTADDLMGLGDGFIFSAKNNQISDLPSNLFSHAQSVSNISFSNNQISSIASGTFSGLSNLKLLDLSNNNLTSLPSDFFDICSISSQLTTISLHGNSFTPELKTSYQSEAAVKCPSVSVSF